MSKIFPKIYLKFDFKILSFHCLQGYIIVLSPQMNSNKYYITTFCIPYNFYSYIIIVTVYQTCPKCLFNQLNVWTIIDFTIFLITNFITKSFYNMIIIHIHITNPLYFLSIELYKVILYLYYIHIYSHTKKKHYNKKINK